MVCPISTKTLSRCLVEINGLGQYLYSAPNRKISLRGNNLAQGVSHLKKHLRSTSHIDPNNDRLTYVLIYLLRKVPQVLSSFLNTGMLVLYKQIPRGFQSPENQKCCVKTAQVLLWKYLNNKLIIIIEYVGGEIKTDL